MLNGVLVKETEPRAPTALPASTWEMAGVAQSSERSRAWSQTNQGNQGCLLRSVVKWKPGAHSLDEAIPDVQVQRCRIMFHGTGSNSGDGGSTDILVGVRSISAFGWGYSVGLDIVVSEGL